MDFSNLIVSSNLYRSDVPIYWSGRWAKQPASLLYPERQNRIYVVPHP